MFVKVLVVVNKSVESDGLRFDNTGFGVERVVRIEMQVRLAIGGFAVKVGTKFASGGVNVNVEI